MVLGAVALFIGYTQPTYGTSVKSLEAEIANINVALLSAQKFKEKEVELTRQQAEIDPVQLARVDAFLPDSVDNVQLIVDLNSLAARSGVELSDFNISGGIQSQETAGDGGAVANAVVLGSGQTFDSLQLSVAATGSYLAFRTFLQGVESSLRPLDVVELAVQDSATGVYTYRITFRLYWLR